MSRRREAQDLARALAVSANDKCGSHDSSSMHLKRRVSPLKRALEATTTPPRRNARAQGMLTTLLTQDSAEGGATGSKGRRARDTVRTDSQRPFAVADDVFRVGVPQKKARGSPQKIEQASPRGGDVSSSLRKNNCAVQDAADNESSVYSDALLRRSPRTRAAAEKGAQLAESPHCAKRLETNARTDRECEQAGNVLGATEETAPIMNTASVDMAKRAVHDSATDISTAEGDARTMTKSDDAGTPDFADAQQRCNVQSSADVAPQGAITGTTAPTNDATRHRLYGKPQITRPPGLLRTTRIPPLHSNRQPLPPPKVRYTAKKEAKKPDKGSDSGEDDTPKPEIDYENEGFL